MNRMVDGWAFSDGGMQMNEQKEDKLDFEWMAGGKNRKVDEWMDV